MSVKKEPSGRRSIAVEIEVPGTPEEVWRAIATGPGVSSWFVPTVIAGRPGGDLVADFGPGMESRSTIGAWEPPHRFTAEGEIHAGAPALGTEWTVEARGGGTCVVRVVHSLFADDDEWDGQLTGAESGWPLWFGVLRIYLAHFQGRPSATIRDFGTAEAPEAELWAALTGGLGLAGAAAGERREAPAGPPPLAGVVERPAAGTHPHSLLVRLDRPAPGVAAFGASTMGGQACSFGYLFLYGDDAAATAARDEAAWHGWLDEVRRGAG